MFCVDLETDLSGLMEVFVFISLFYFFCCTFTRYHALTSPICCFFLFSIPLCEYHILFCGPFSQSFVREQVYVLRLQIDGEE